ncbi:hypothetical protein SAMN04515618_108100 [Collimonas sp. OK307]|uniref:hypothetical protein n=1 Tax=Collimonas sp. OK307 TaxID=1801620 RepID=UPI0008EF70F2|nr:hypothetical protein [Collimonas sp. OK307]SFI03127.1 hypothetical protein SAMN04515618_108100 [Collimonas sp. OK307]
MDNESDGFRAFRGLPITREQDAEIQAYIVRCKAAGRSWDNLELDYIIKDMLYPAPTDERIEICDEYASNLANRVRRTGEMLNGFTREAHVQDCDMCTEAEWKWIVHEAGRRL